MKKMQLGLRGLHMDTRIKERCIYCGGDVYYHGSEQLVKCEWCGHTLVVAKFENELARMKKTEEENVLIRRKLAEAEKEKQAADDRLFAALTSLGEIQNEQDVLGKILNALSGGQGEALDRLEFLQWVSSQLLNSQDDVFARVAVIPEMAAQLQRMDMDAQQSQSVMNDFMSWIQQIREEDFKRLQGIESTTGSLLAGQQEIYEKIDGLKQAADQHQQTLAAFQDQYTKDKLEELEQLYRQAADFQQDRVFDKAEEYYRKILVKGGGDAEVYWRLLMCHYCLFYQKDGDGSMIPIILNPDLTDPAEMSLRRELEHHMTEQERPYYAAQLQKIDRILDKYRLLKDRVQYDVFISVKQESDGHYTADSDVAANLYDFLIDQGLRVFNSRRTMIPAGQEYEPYIISALMSAKTLIVVGTDPDNMNSPWVRNEWSRFQWLQFREKEKTGKTERVLICYLAKGMQARQIPKALNPNRQAIFDGVKAHDELLEAIAFLNRGQGKKESVRIIRERAPQEDFRTVETQLKFWLFKGKYDKVQEKYEELTEQGLYLTHAALHLAALCAKNRVSDIRKIVCSETVLDQTEEYRAAVMFCGSEEEKRDLSALLKQNIEWRSRSRAEKMFRTLSGQKLLTYPAQSLIKSRNGEEWFLLGKKAAGEGKYKEAAEWYQKAAEAGNAAAQNNLGVYYRNGRGVSKNRDEAVKWFQEASRQGFHESQYNLGLSYWESGTSQGREEGVRWFQKAAAQGNAKAQFMLGKSYSQGWGVPEDKAEAFRWYKMAAEQGHSMAQYSLALFYEKGTGVTVNKAEARKWYQKAAENGVKWAKEKLDQMKNENVILQAARPSKQTVKKEAVKKEDTAKQMSAEDWFQLGKKADNEKNYSEAVKWYLKAAEQGYADAQNNLGFCYDNGKGVEKDPKQAVYWYQKAAEQGYAGAQFNLALCYKDGTGVEQDPKQKVYWYQKAAEQGYATAQTNLGVCYDNGTGVEKDPKQAVYWYQKAAEQGYAGAQNNLGLCYNNGKGVEKDPQQAVYWYQKAAEQGYASAQFNLGLCYENGKGVEQDQKQALSWYQKAADQGDEDAKAKVKQLTKKKRWFF